MRLSKNYILAIYVMIANFFDALWTHQAIEKGNAEELNPLMDFLLSHQTYTFYIVKLGLVTLGVILLIRLRSHKASFAALAFVSIVYTVVLGIHWVGPLI